MIQNSGITRRTLLAAAVSLPVCAAAAKPSVAVTMDDVNWSVLADPLAANARLLEVARRHGAQFGLFVIGRNADTETGNSIVSSWKDAGHLIGNHTYTHRVFNNLSFEDFSSDVLRAEKVLEPFLSRPGFFRFPALKEGETAEKRDRMREFLTGHNYRNAHVTIDASDWYYDNRLRDRLARDPGFDPARYRQPYLDHLWDRAQFYDELSRKVLGRSVPHTLLVHYNLLNSLFLSDALEMFMQRGWRLAGAADTFRDPVFQARPNNLPAGESLLWALAKQTGKFESLLRYPGEDDIYEKPKLDRLGL